MSVHTEKVISDVLELPVHIRAFVAEKILESLDIGEDKEISNEWKAEISRRCKEIDEGNVELVDAKEVFSRAYSVLE